jgi:hypothetical protein
MDAIVKVVEGREARKWANHDETVEHLRKQHEFDLNALKQQHEQEQRLKKEAVEAVGEISVFQSINQLRICLNVDF